MKILSKLLIVLQSIRKIPQNILVRLRIRFRSYYEARLSLPFGICQFIGAFANLQLGPEEFVSMMNPWGTRELILTGAGLRPKLSYLRYDEQSDSWIKTIAIIEERGFNVTEDEIEWFIVDINDDRVKYLKDIFLASAFYPVVRPEQKRKRA